MPRSRAALFDPRSREPFVLSRSKIDLYVECPRCFYLDRRLGVARPPLPAFTLNSAVDALLKKEFDSYRLAQRAHPLMESYGVDAIPFAHEELDTWRENFKGLRHHHKPTNFTISGALDDVWATPAGDLIVVDYKATSKEGELTLDGFWQQGYKRQLEIYQWLLRRRGFSVSPTAYILYANADKSGETFSGQLSFALSILPHAGSDQWIEPILHEIRQTLRSASIPPTGEHCQYCPYREAAGRGLRDHVSARKG